MTKMDIMYLLGVASGIAFTYCYQLVAQHQRRKQRDRDRKAARAWKI